MLPSPAPMRPSAALQPSAPPSPRVAHLSFGHQNSTTSNMSFEGFGQTDSINSLRVPGARTSVASFSKTCPTQMTKLLRNSIASTDGFVVAARSLDGESLINRPVMPRSAPAPPSEPQSPASPSVPSQPPDHAKFLGWRPSTNHLRKSGVTGVAARETKRMAAVPAPVKHGCTFSEGFWPQFYKEPKHLPGAIETGGPGPTGGSDFRAIWSDIDGDELGRRDDFDMKRWRAEFARELAEAQSHMLPGLHGAALPGDLPPHENIEAHFAQEAASMGVVLRDDGTALAHRVRSQRKTALRQRQKTDSAAQMQRRACADRRDEREFERRSRATMSRHIGPLATVEDFESIAKEEEIQQTIARIMTRKTRPDISIVLEEDDGDMPLAPMKALRGRIKVAVTQRLRTRRMQAKKLKQLNDARASRVAALPQSEHDVLQEAFDYYSTEVGGKSVVQVVDLPNCLLEAGLAGTNCRERWSVDRVCKEIVFALTLEYGSLEKIPPIASFRGSLIPKFSHAGSDHSSRAAKTPIGPELRKITRNESGVPETEKKAKEEIGKLVEAPVALDFLDSVSSTVASPSSRKSLKRSPTGAGGSRASVASSANAELARTNQRASSARASTLVPLAEEEELKDAASQSPQTGLSASRKSNNSFVPLPLSDLEEEEDAPSILDLASRASVESFRKSGRNTVTNLASSDSPLSHALTAEGFWQASPVSTGESTPSSGGDPGQATAEASMTRRGATLGQHASFKSTAAAGHDAGDSAGTPVKGLAAAVVALQAARKFMLAHPISFVDFAVELVPVVREEIMEVRNDLHFPEFMHMLEGSAGAVSLSMQQFDRLATRLGISREVFTRCVVDLPPLDNSSEEESDGNEGNLQMGSKRQSSKPPSSRVPASKNQEDPRLHFDAVHEMLCKMEEAGEYKKKSLEWQIMRRTGISKEKFLEHRNELIRLSEFFQLYDIDGNDSLSVDEVLPLLKHIGLEPYRSEETELVCKLLQTADVDGDDSLSFAEFLELMAKVREYQKQERDPSLIPHFKSLANGAHPPRLEIDKVDQALIAAGIVGKTRFEKDLQRKLVCDWDVDNSGDISFTEFSDICQCVQECLFCHRTEEIVKYATSLGIQRHRLSSYLWSFDKCDVSRSDGLSMTQIEKILYTVTVKPPKRAELEEMFNMCGIDHKALVPLEQYLQIIHVASDSNMSHDESDWDYKIDVTPIQSPASGKNNTVAEEKTFTLRDVPVQKLREILGLFMSGPLSEAEIKQLEAHEMMERIAGYLGVQSHSNLREEFAKPVENVRQLFAMCKFSAESK